MRGRRGGMIAEAAVVFPAVLIAVMAVLHMLIAMYTEAAYSARDHLALRYESGTRTETVERAEGYSGLAPGDRFGRAPFREDAGIIPGVKFPDSLLHAERGRAFLIDERSHIRKADLLSGMKGEQ